MSLLKPSTQALSNSFKKRAMRLKTKRDRVQSAKGYKNVRKSINAGKTTLTHAQMRTNLLRLGS